MNKTNKILSLIFAFLIVISFIPITASAVETEGSCGDNLTWTFDESTGTLTILGEGAMYNYANSYSVPWHANINSMESVIISDGVTTIGNSSFYNNKNIKNVSIADSVTDIGERAFYNCTGLTDVVIGKGATVIGDFAFEDCSNLKTVTIYNAVEEICRYAFNGCSKLTDVYYWGTEAEWNAIKKATLLSKTGLENATIHFLGEETHECSYNAVVTAPTCTEQGYTTYTCECRDSYVADYVNATGHSHTSEVTTPATHTETGIMTYTCVCGDTYTEAIEKLEKHNYEIVVTVPTCTEQGYRTYTCECGDSYVDDYVDATGHNYSSEITIPATHTTTGIMTYTCACGDSYTEVIEKLEKHNYESVVTAPTCTEQGYTTYTCECGDSYVADYVDALGHIDNDNNNCCDKCSKNILPTSGTYGDNVTWTFDESTGTLTFSGTGEMQHATSHGVPWNGHIDSIENVIISEGVTTIGDKVFYNHKNIKNVSIADSVTAIDDEAFLNCTGLTDVVIGKGVTMIGEFAFQNCSNLKTVTIYNAVEEICRYAFNGCSKLTDVYYFGTEAEWNAITKATLLSKTGLENATIHFLGEETHECSYNAVVTAPTCKEQGYTTYTCGCGDSYVDDYVDATGHNHASEITTPATHTTTGVMTYTCSCGDIYTEVIAKLEKHNYESVVTAPTCTEQGYTTYTCECGDSYVDDYVDALGHTEEIIPAVAPTCTETGLTEGAKCSVCGETLTEQKELPANGHSPANAVEENYVAPTCTENGSKDVVVYCSVCEEEISRETVTLEATGHTDVHNDGICDSCDLQLCNHRCHKLGIAGFFWRIFNVFNMLFGLNETCECGVAHY